MAMDEQCAAGVIHLIARGKFDMSERFDDVEQSPRLNVDARAPQHPAEDQKVVEEERHRRPSRARGAPGDRAIEQLRDP